MIILIMLDNELRLTISVSFRLPSPRIGRATGGLVALAETGRQLRVGSEWRASIAVQFLKTVGLVMRPLRTNHHRINGRFHIRNCI